MTTNTMNTRTARSAGYRALTGRFYLPGEQAMLDGVLADMRRGSISHVLVKDRLGVAVWRKGRAGVNAHPAPEQGERRLETCDTADWKSALRGSRRAAA
jgi:hypothetical protein